MALDKHRILNELGSVVNQLQSADCGCMSKLFSSPNESVLPTYGGCGSGCCHRHSWNYPYNCSATYGSPSAGEPYPSMNTNTNRPCTTFCNPRKLYADTYNYLNQNLMQPVVKEVYDDLKSITPANTIMNNSMAGASQGSLMGHNNAGYSMQNYQMSLGDKNPTGTMQIKNTPGTNLQDKHEVNSNQPVMGHMTGMGPNIVNMMMSRTDHKSNVNEQGGTTPSISGQVQNSERIMQHNNGLQMQNPSPNYMPQLQITPQSQQFNVNTIQSYSNAIDNEHTPPINPIQTTAIPQQSQYGVHSQGVKKFNEMFPGVTQGFGGDLGFDPMAIAINMNPANKQNVAMDNMRKLIGKPAVTRANTAAVSLDQNAKSINSEARHEVDPASNQLQTVQQQLVPKPPAYQQEVYTASTFNPQIQNNIETANMQHNNNDQIPSQKPLLKETIFPIDTSKNLTQDLSVYKQEIPNKYSTLGQSFDTLPLNVELNLPQNLSPQSAPPILKTGQNTYSNVKSTMSKTSIVGNKPVGKTTSRSQLQHIYNQYKGSHSHTQQNINQHSQNPTHSDGKLNVTQKSYNQISAPIEQIGGDHNNPLTNIEKNMGQVGDVPLANSSGDNVVPEQIPRPNNSKCRNGLQDMVFTSYPTSTAWSFHGDGTMSRSIRQSYRKRA